MAQILSQILDRVSPGRSVEDARCDQRFQESPLVTGFPNVRFYAGVPISLGDGFNVGVICVFDQRARQLSAMQNQYLKETAQLIACLLENRKSSLQLRNTIRLKSSEVMDSSDSFQIATLAHRAARLTHEISNPLGILMLSADLLRKKLEVVPNSDQFEAPLKKIETAGQRIKRILHSVNTYSRNSKNDEPVFAKIKDILDDTLQFCDETLEKEEINIRIDEFDPELEFQCRPVEISQVLLNLIQNSCDAIKSLSEKWIKISIKAHLEFLEISILDSGRGIPLRLQRRIFEPYFTTKKINCGTGLGLPICKELIESHGGSLSVDLQSENTCFLIRIPRQQKIAA